MGDICVNDDINPGVNTDAGLEILVPAGREAQVELNIRVSDWNGQVGGELPYEMQVQETSVPPEAVRRGSSCDGLWFCAPQSGYCGM